MSKRQATTLVKFTDAEIAKTILVDSKLRMSAPCIFEDPFELSHLTTLNFDTKALLQACVKTTLNLIFTRDEPKGNNSIIKAVRRWRAENRFETEDEAKEVLTELLSSMVANREPEILDLVTLWKAYSRKLRLLCFSESHEVSCLWHKYAKQHSGVAIRFSCDDDSALADPAQVQYGDIRPEVTTLSEQQEIVLYQSRFNPQESFPTKFLTKSNDYQQEKEWRLLKTGSKKESSDADPDQWFDYLPFNRQDVKALYFGARIEPRIRQELMNTMKAKYPTARLFQASVKAGKFALDFERLNPS